MGHERLGLLPKTRKWRDVVRDIAGVYASDTEVSDIVRKTTQNILSRFRNLDRDEGVVASFKFLVALSVASRGEDPRDELLLLGIRLPANVTPLSLAKALQDWMSTRKGSFEYRQLAFSAGTDAIAIWSDRNRPRQRRLFDTYERPFDVWSKAASGAGFCELARLFFAKLTERYLNYFLEREASANLRSLEDRDKFRDETREHVDQVSKHAFETARITQSFAAGWFNKNAREGMPSDEQIQGFLYHAFGKLREELQREEGAQ